MITILTPYSLTNNSLDPRDEERLCKNAKSLSILAKIPLFRQVTKPFRLGALLLTVFSDRSSESTRTAGTLLLKIP